MRSSLASGSAASAASLLALIVAGRRENNDASAPTNAVSHWVWGSPATRKDGLSVRHTLVGYAIHHLASVFWAIFYEKWFGREDTRKTTAQALGEQAAVAALACFVDFRLTPERLTPGFEKRLSKKSLFAVYVAFGLGLGVPRLLRNSRRRPSA
jgi:hypothetical protein